MNTDVTIITPEIDPGVGGLADYTLRLVQEWRSNAAVQLIVPRRSGRATATAETITEIDPSSDALLSNLPANGGAVLVQYSAYGFDRLGYPRWLLHALLKWKKRSGGVLVIMFHEIWTFWPVLNKNYLVQQLHRHDIRALLKQADAVFTSTASQAEHLQILAPNREVEILPVGSNVRPIRAPVDHEREPGLAVLFGLQGTRLRTLEKMRAELLALCRQKRIKKLITAGAGSRPDDDVRESLLLGELQLSEGFKQCGALPEREVSALLLSASFGVSSQDELSVTKSGTLMAYAAHGLNVISPVAAAGKPQPICWFTAAAELLGGSSPSELSRRAAALREWQERTASWPHLASQFAHALRLPEPHGTKTR